MLCETILWHSSVVIDSWNGKQYAKQCVLFRGVTSRRMSWLKFVSFGKAAMSETNRNDETKSEDACTIKSLSISSPLAPARELASLHLLFLDQQDKPSSLSLSHSLCVFLSYSIHLSLSLQGPV